MPLVFNGVTIPEDEENVLSFNGVDITKVNFNGVDVWEQLLELIWSGASLNSSDVGFDVIGNQWAWRDDVGGHGEWQSVNTDGTFTGDSIDSYNYGFDTSANLIRTVNNGTYASNWVTYSIETKKFSGTSTANGAYGYIELETEAGGMMRYEDHSGAGAYISLT